MKWTSDDPRDGGRTHTISQGVATKIGNKIWKDWDTALKYFPDYLNGSYHYQFKLSTVSRFAVD